MVSEEQVIGQLKKVYDPEVPVDIYNFGLIYGIDVQDGGQVAIRMTLTSEACPAAKRLPDEVKRSVERLDGVSCSVELVWEPRWSLERISPAGRETLRLDQED